MNLLDIALVVGATGITALAAITNAPVPAPSSEASSVSVAEYQAFLEGDSLDSATRCFTLMGEGFGQLVYELGRGLKSPPEVGTLNQYPYPPRTALAMQGSPERGCFASEITADNRWPVRRDYFTETMTLDNGQRVKIGLVETDTNPTAHVLYWVPE